MFEVLFLTLSGVILFSVLNLGSFSLLFKEGRSKYLILSLIAIIVFVYQEMTYRFHLALTVEDALSFLQIQTTSVLFFLPLFFVYTAKHIDFPHRKFGTLLTVAISLIFILAHYLQPFGIRYTEMPQLVSFTQLNTEIHILQGPSSLWYVLYRLYSYVYFMWIVYVFAASLKTRRILFSITILVFGLSLLAAAIMGHLIDTGIVKYFYIGGFSFVYLVVMVNVNLFYDYRDKLRTISEQSQTISIERTEKEKIQRHEMQLEQVFTQNPVASHIFTMDGSLLHSNTAAQTFWSEHWESNVSKLWGFLKALYPNLGRQKVENIELPAVLLDKDIKKHGFKGLNKMWLSFKIYSLQGGSRTAEELVVLIRDVTLEYISDQAIRHIAHNPPIIQIDEYFNQMVLNICKILSVEHAFLGVLNPADSTITTIAAADHGEIIPNYTYDLEGAPCYQVLANSVCTYVSGVQKAFPYDSFLKSRNIEGFAGIKLFDLNNTPLGILVVMDSAPLINKSAVEDVLRIYAVRAGNELNRHRAELKVRKMAFEDYLTKLPNRSMLNDRLLDILKHPAPEGRKTVFLLLDVDLFKQHNNVFGLNVGDKLLIAISQRLSRDQELSGFLARTGGDEFALVKEISGKPEDLARHVISLFNEPFIIGDHIIEINVSIGVVEIEEKHTSVFDIVRYAELALETAKDNGRGTFCLYEKELQERENKRLVIVEALKKALKDEALSIHLQPQISSSSEVYGAEVLVRWTDPELGFVSPAVFIPIAEESGLIHGVGDLVIKKSVDFLKSWPGTAAEFPGHLAINISAWQFLLPDFVPSIQKILTDAGLPFDKIALEITETSLLNDIEDTKIKLSQLQKLGIMIALDDFGTGYSSLAYLRDLPIDLLKIDKAFIDELESTKTTSLVESMIAIGHAMKLTVIAEGVETEAQRTLLEKMGCFLFQGYLFSRPIDSESFYQWYLNWKNS